jgi:O-antigen/teichoic acid export membrane protein
LIAKHVEVDIFGRYSLYLSVVSAASMLLIGWSNAALLRYGREEWNESGAIGESLAARILLYIIGIFVAGVAIFLLDPHIKTFLKVDSSFFVWVFLGVILIPLAETWIYANLAVGRSLAFAYIPVLKRTILLFGIAIIPFFIISEKLTHLIVFTLAAALLSSFAALLYLPKGALGNFRLHRSVLEKIIRYSWAIPFGGASAYIVSWIDLWIIRAYMSTGDVGLYSWAYLITTIAPLAFAPFAAIFTPAMVDARVKNDYEPMVKLAHRSLRMVILFEVIGVFVLAFVYPFLYVLVEPDYLKSYAVLLILLSALPLQLLGYLMTPIGNSFEGLIPKVVVITVIMAVSNIAGDLLLVPLLGMSGAAVSTWIVFVGSSIAVFYLLSRHISGFPKVINFFIVCVVMPLGVLSLIFAGPKVGSVLCVVIATATLFIARQLGLFSIDDLQWIESQPVNRRAKMIFASAARWLAKA